MRDYYKELYANKMDNLEEMEKFLQRYNLLRLNQEEIANTNKPITSTESETDLKTSRKKKISPGPDCFTFYQTFRDDLIPILLKLLQKFSEEGTHPSSFYEATITLIPKPKIPPKRKLHANITNEHRCKKILNKLLPNQIQQCIKSIICHN